MPTCPPWWPLLLLSLWEPLLRSAEAGSEGQTAGALYQRWERYRRECQETLEASERPAVAKGFVLRQCGSDGQWGPWRDHSQCENPEKNGVFQDQRLTLERLQVVYTVGYSLSLATLLFALLILSTFRRLRCTRNYIHINLFTSFMLRAAAILTRDRLLPPPGPYPGDQVLTSWNQINFLIFIRILGILVSKLRTRQMRCPDYRLRLARSTLTLVPLLGVHEVVFAPVTEEQARGALRLAKLGFEIFLSSFQPPPLSAVRFQVQSEIRRGWHRCRLRHSLGEEPRQQREPAFRTLPSGSGPGQVAAGRALCSRTLPGPGGEANHVLESYC
ncbi:hypothetical protein G4228_002559 [Cervus hanglu yarkandensis]|nr:hypothetical protein G4228_002559 [Cervus hanglu yarkandensis]